jgi:type IV secretory pathway TrbL component
MIFLGFGGSRWTQPYLERLIALNVSVGLKLMLLYLLVSAGQTLAGQWLTWADAITGPSGIVSSWAIAGAALLYAAVCWHVPRFLSGMLSGAAGFSIGEVTSTAGSIALAGYAGYHVMAGAKAALAHSMAGVSGAITGSGANGAHTGSAAAGFNGSGGGHTAGPPSSVPPPTVPPPAPAAPSSGSYVPPPPRLDAAATLYTMHQAMPGPSEAPAPPPQTPLGDRD